MDLRIIPGKSDEFDLENFALKDIKADSGKCEFYIQNSKILSTLFGILFLFFN